MGAFDDLTPENTITDENGDVLGVVGNPFVVSIDNSTSGSCILSIATKTGNYTPTDEDCTILADATGGELAITLPAASTVTGLLINIKKKDSSSNFVIIDGNATEQIDGYDTLTITKQNTCISVQSDGTGWFII